MVTSDPKKYKELLPFLGFKQGGKSGATILGAHLEGPFISESKYGAHNVAFIQSAIGGEAGVRQVYGSDISNVRIVTLAPELPGAEEAVRFLVQNNVIVSAGHSTASYAQGVEALGWGVSLVTHLFNAMNAFHHRDPGLVGLIAAPSPPFYSVISDGIHSHPASLRIANATNPEKIIIITDAGMAMGLGLGTFKLGTLDIDIRRDEHGTRATLHNSDVLAGSVADMAESTRNLRAFTRCDAAHAIAAASTHPAQCLRIDHKKGRIAHGYDADFILIDEEMNVHATFINGELVWGNEAWLQNMPLD